MSLSRPEQEISQSPVTTYINYNGEHGKFIRRKKGGEKEDIGKTLKFIVIDDAGVKISGWDENNKINYSSNVVKTKEGILTVKQFKEGGSSTLISGSYEQIKDKLPKDAKYTRCIYLYDIDAKEYCLWGATGSQLIGFFEHLNEIKVRSLAGRVVAVRKHLNEVNGAVKYIRPVFESRVPTENEQQLIAELTEWDSTLLQPFLDGNNEESRDAGKDNYRENLPNAPMPTEEPPNLNDIDDDLPF